MFLFRNKKKYLIPPLIWSSVYASAAVATAFGVVGWCDGAGKLSVPERPTIWITAGQGPNALVVGAGGGCLDIFTLIFPFSPLPPSLWETAQYRLKYCLKGPLNSKQPTNQPATAFRKGIFLLEPKVKT